MKGIYKIIKAIIRYIKKDNLYLEQFAVGINSFIDQENDVHIVMLDYDTKDYDFIKADVIELGNFFNLSDCDSFETNNGYHIFYWFDHIPYSRLKMIINFSRCDSMYKYISRYYNHKTVRACGKYKELDTRFIERIRGKRKPSDKELELGNLKRMEYLNLRRFHKVLDKKTLKEAVENENN